jgi:glycosyltransferase involved in cell wall biosynthesis
MPLVSVIIPSYNHRRFLVKRIESVLNQTFDDFEILLIDDHSTDGSWDVIQKYADNKQVSVIHRNSINSGSPFLQWQKGANLAKGEYLWIAESDDYAGNDFLKKQLSNLMEDEDIGVSFCPSIWVDLENNEISKPSHENLPLKESGNSLIVNEFAKGCLIYNASSAVFRKELISKVDFEAIKKFKYTGDWLFWVQLINNTTVVRIPERLNYFRRHSDNVSFKSNKAGLQFSEGYKIVQYIFEKHLVGFFKKRKINMFWALKVANDNDIDHSRALSMLPFEIKLWYRLMPFLKLFVNQ